MKYEVVKKAVFLARPNRFIAYVKMEDGKEEKVHVLNTGRCKELLLPGAAVFLSQSSNPARKTKYDLISVEKTLSPQKKILINMDSHITNSVAEEYLLSHDLFGDIFPSLPSIKREVCFGASRFDMFLEGNGKKMFLEVKSVTLEEKGTVLFPDAPTLRGVKHLEELLSAKQAGLEAAVLFVVQLKGASRFQPNTKTHPLFASTLKKVYEKGVRIKVMDCIVTPDSIQIDSELPFFL